MLSKKAPTAEFLLSKLVELYADQQGVTINYEISNEGSDLIVQRGVCARQLRSVQAT